MVQINTEGLDQLIRMPDTSRERKIESELELRLRHEIQAKTVGLKQAVIKLSLLPSITPIDTGEIPPSQLPTFDELWKQVDLTGINPNHWDSYKFGMYTMFDNPDGTSTLITVEPYPGLYGAEGGRQAQNISSTARENFLTIRVTKGLKEDITEVQKRMEDWNPWLSIHRTGDDLIYSPLSPRPGSIVEMEYNNAQGINMAVWDPGNITKDIKKELVLEYRT